MKLAFVLLGLPSVAALCVNVDASLAFFSLRLGEGSCTCEAPACGERILAANGSACFTKNSSISCATHVNVGGSLAVKGEVDEHKCHTFDIAWDGTPTDAPSAASIYDGDPTDACSRLTNTSIKLLPDASCASPPCTQVTSVVDAKCNVYPYQPCDTSQGDVCCGVNATCQDQAGASAGDPPRHTCQPAPPPGPPPGKCPAGTGCKADADCPGCVCHTENFPALCGPKTTAP